MTIPFYKLQIAGNNIVLVDIQQLPSHEGKSPKEILGTFDIDKQSLVSMYICDRRYGIGASALAFLYPDNHLKVYNPKGKPLLHAHDVLLCVARYAYDAGRAKNKIIELFFGHEKYEIQVLGSHEFRLSIGSAFSLLTGEIISPTSIHFTETIENKGITTSFSAIHVREDCLIAHPKSTNMLKWKDLLTLSKQAFPQKQVIPVLSKILTRDSLLLYTNTRLASGISAAATSAACSAIFLGECDSEVLVLFKTEEQDTNVENAIARDLDNSRRLAIEWNAQLNDFAVIGTGGYIFEGKYDVPFQI